MSGQLPEFDLAGKPIERPFAKCHFCGEPPPASHPAWGWERVCAGDRWHQQPVILCQRHYEILRDAGERGRVYGPTGVRWWLACS